MDDEKGIAGFKKSEFQAATPERVLGQDVRIEELPTGIRLYLKEKAVDLQTKKILVNVYRLVDDGGLKNKKVWVGKIVNRKPDEDEIAERFGGGSFIWIGKWLSLDGQERGIISDVIEIDEDFGRAAHESWMRKQGGGPDSTPAPAALPAMPAASPFANDALSLLKIMEAAEEKTLARFERMAAVFNGQKSETPAQVLESAYKGASEMMQRAVETNLNMAQAVNKASKAALAAPAPVAEVEEPDGQDDGPQLPSWLAPFMPQIQAGLGKLLDGGPVGSAVKTLILTSDEWKTIFADKEKWGQAVAAMENQFGSERTAAALDILLNRRKDVKKGKK